MRLTRESVNELTKEYYKQFPTLRKELYKFCFEDITPKVVDKIFKKLRNQINNEVATLLSRKLLQLK